MPKEISFQKLCKEYATEEKGFVEVTDRKAAFSDIVSTTSCCWGAGGKIGETGWIQLASPSKQRAEDKRTVFVCRASLVAIDLSDSGPYASKDDEGSAAESERLRKDRAIDDIAALTNSSRPKEQLKHILFGK